MAFEISEQLVSLAHQSLGYFVIEGLKVGRKEVDLLAIRVGKNGRIVERKHIEVQISVRPLGALRAGMSAWEANRNPTKAAREWAATKFKHPRVAEAVRAAFGGKPYDYVLVHGKLKKPEQVPVLRKCDVRCEDAFDLIRRAYLDGKHNQLHRAVGIAERITDHKVRAGNL